MLWRIYEVKNLLLLHFLKVKINFIAFSILYIHKVEITLKHKACVSLQAILKLVRLFPNLFCIIKIKQISKCYQKLYF